MLVTLPFFIMNDYYLSVVWKMTKDAYLVSSNINRSTEDRLSCIKFLFKLNKRKMALNYEGNKFEIYYTVYIIVALIKKKEGALVAYSNLTRFYPELAQPYIFDALNSQMFDLTLE